MAKRKGGRHTPKGTKVPHRQPPRFTRRVPQAKVEYFDPDGNLVRTELVDADKISREEMEAQNQRTLEMLERRERAHRAGLWLPGDDLP